MRLHIEDGEQDERNSANDRKCYTQSGHPFLDLEMRP